MLDNELDISISAKYTKKMNNYLILLSRRAAWSACYLVSSQLGGSWLKLGELLANELHWEVLRYDLRPGADELNPFQGNLGQDPNNSQNLISTWKRRLCSLTDWYFNPAHSGMCSIPVGTWLRLMTEQQRDKWNTSSLQEWFSPPPPAVEDERATLLKNAGASHRIPN